MKRHARQLAAKVYRSFNRNKNRLASKFQSPYSRVFYVIESKNWSISWDGYYITHNVERNSGIGCRTTRFYEGISRQILHFGSRNIYLGDGRYRSVDPSNRTIFTWFHGSESDLNPENQKMIRAIPECISLVDKVVTSSSIAKGRLIGWGVPESKLKVIPLGIDLERFQPAMRNQYESIREQLGIPEDAVCIGSFQKDGNGWGEGYEPKLVKGPDTLLKVVEELAGRYKLFVLLTGPARGYVKRGLEMLNVPYGHTFLKNYYDIVKYYQALDVYLVTSRDEGGPKAVLECMATGVPVVSTRVGMAPDVIQDGENGFLADVEDVGGLVAATQKLIEDSSLKQKFREAGSTTILDYDWAKIGKQYVDKVYNPLLERR